MKQAIFTAPRRTVIRTADIPEFNDEQLLLKTAYMGVCGSDIQIYKGRHKYAEFPVVPGHEVSASIAAVGRNVKGFAPGDKVTCLPQISCGKCYPCKTGRFNVCENLKVMGVHTDGFAAEYVSVYPENLCRCPEDMDADLIALAEPLAVAIGSVKRGRYKDANIAVIGAGTIGNFIAQAAAAMGSPNVLIADIENAKLDFARDCGIKHTVNTGDIPLARAIEDSFGYRKADIIIDAAAAASSFGTALEAARPGSEIIITGNYKEPVTLDVPLIQRREVNLIGHMMYVKEDFEEAVEFLYSNKVKGKKMISRVFDLEDFPNVFDYIEKNSKNVMKVLVKMK